MAGVKGRSGGHNRKPTSVLKREGGYRRARHGERSDLAYEPAELTPPRGLGRDGKWLWTRIVDGTPRDVLSAVDVPCLFAMCRWWNRWRRLDRIVEPDAWEFKQQTATWQQFAKLASQFGMSPSARAALKVPPPTPDPMDDPFVRLSAMSEVDE